MADKVKDLEVVKKSLQEEERTKRAKFAHLFGSVEEFEETLRAVKEKEGKLAEARNQVEILQKEKEHCIISCRRVDDNIQRLRDEWRMKLKLEFPQFSEKLGLDFSSRESKKLSEMTKELREDMGRKCKQLLQRKAELEETMGLKETSIFRLRHEHETLQADCVALQERIDKIRENIDRLYKVIDRCETQKKKFSKLRDSHLQMLQQDHRNAQLVISNMQSEMDQFVDQMKELDDYVKSGGTVTNEQVGSKKAKARGKKKKAQKL